MPATIEPPEPDAATGPSWRRWAWFFGLALASALATAAVAYGMRALLNGA